MFKLAFTTSSNDEMQRMYHFDEKTLLSTSLLIQELDSVREENESAAQIIKIFFRDVSFNLEWKWLHNSVIKFVTR